MKKRLKDRTFEIPNWGRKIKKGTWIRFNNERESKVYSGKVVEIDLQDDFGRIFKIVYRKNLSDWEWLDHKDVVSIIRNGKITKNKK